MEYHRTESGDRRIVSGILQVYIDSFGYRHQRDQPLADLTLDMRRHFRDPHVSPDMRNMTGLDPEVQAHVLATRGVRNYLTGALRVIVDLLGDVGDATWPGKAQRTIVRVATGCEGGRHRSVAAAEFLADELGLLDIGTDVIHRDLLLPVLPSASVRG